MIPAYHNLEIQTSWLIEQVYKTFWIRSKINPVLDPVPHCSQPHVPGKTYRQGMKIAASATVASTNWFSDIPALDCPGIIVLHPEIEVAIIEKRSNVSLLPTLKGL